MFGLAHSDVEYIVGEEIATKILEGGKILPEDVISDQLMDLFTFQLDRGLEGLEKAQRLISPRTSGRHVLQRRNGSQRCAPHKTGQVKTLKSSPNL